MNKKLSISIPEDNCQKTNKKESLKNTESNHQQPRSYNDVQDSNSEMEISRYYKLQNNKQQQSPFQQFTVQKKLAMKKSQLRKHNKFQIEVPDINFQQNGKMIGNQGQNLLEVTYKEPPAPSRASKTKFFNFPTITDQMYSDKKQSHKKVTKEEELNEKIIELQHEIQNQKQKYEKQCAVKDAQIQLLQKIIKQYLERKQEYNSEDIKSMLKAKDSKNAELLNKISQLSMLVKNINSEILTYKTQNYKLSKQIQNLKNQLYIYQKKQENNKLNQDFQEIRKLEMQEKKYWQQKHKSFNKSKNQIKNIDELNKRFELLKQNRRQLELEKSKLKNKSFTISNHKDQSSIPCKAREKVNLEYSGNKQKFSYQKIVDKQNRSSSFVD